jgi:hypothetical protein
MDLNHVFRVNKETNTVLWEHAVINNVLQPKNAQKRTIVESQGYVLIAITIAIPVKKVLHVIKTSNVLRQNARVMIIKLVLVTPNIAFKGYATKFFVHLTLIALKLTFVNLKDFALFSSLSAKISTFTHAMASITTA